MSLRTDLVTEKARDHVKNLPKGVLVHTTKSQGIDIETVNIIDDEGAKIIGKEKGTYVTINIENLGSYDKYSNEQIDVISEKIREFIGHGKVLVVGLGNRDITPDALGPRTIERILATRHISHDMAKSIGLDGLRSVSAVATGVMGQTGIESSEIIKAVTEETKPDTVVVIDALAARSMARLGTTIQVSNSGISPGSGVLNKRKELSKNTLGTNVVSIGIPTVVDMQTAATDLIGEDNVNTEDISPKGKQMMVTPREIDLVISRGAKLLGTVLNVALQPSISIDDISYLTT